MLAATDAITTVRACVLKTTYLVFRGVESPCEVKSVIVDENQPRRKHQTNECRPRKSFVKNDFSEVPPEVVRRVHKFANELISRLEKYSAELPSSLSSERKHCSRIYQCLNEKYLHKQGQCLGSLVHVTRTHQWLGPGLCVRSPLFRPERCFVF